MHMPFQDRVYQQLVDILASNELAEPFPVKEYEFAFGKSAPCERSQMSWFKNLRIYV